MFHREFPDGSDFTHKHFALALVIGAVCSVPLIIANEKRVAWQTKRIMKKYNWPKDAIVNI